MVEVMFKNAFCLSKVRCMVRGWVQDLKTDTLSSVSISNHEKLGLWGFSSSSLFEIIS